MTWTAEPELANLEGDLEVPVHELDGMCGRFAFLPQKGHRLLHWRILTCCAGSFDYQVMGRLKSDVPLRWLEELITPVVHQLRAATYGWEKRGGRL